MVQVIDHDSFGYSIAKTTISISSDFCSQIAIIWKSIIIIHRKIWFNIM